VTPVPIRLVLDTSAVVEFTRASIHVGEVLSEVVDEQAIAVLPVICLVEAVHAVADPALLDVLIGHPAVALLDEQASEWRMLAEVYAIVGRLDAAAAGLAALDARTAILTKQPGLYAGLGDGRLVIPIGE
jgi:hypothetical protein